MDIAGTEVSTDATGIEAGAVETERGTTGAVDAAEEARGFEGGGEAEEEARVRATASS
jgi:hypothetical protein